MTRKRTPREQVAHRLMLVFALAAVIGTAAAGYWLFMRDITLRVAVSKAGGDDATILNTLNDWMVSDGRRFRLRLLVSGSPEKSLEMLRSGAVDMAAVRADSVTRDRVSSIAVLHQDIAGIVLPPGSTIKSWTDLSSRAIGAYPGTQPDDMLLAALLRLNGVSDAKMVELDGEKVKALGTRRGVAAVAFVSPLVSRTVRPLRSLVPGRGEVPVVLGIEDPEALAAKDKRYMAGWIIAGSLRTTPPVPAEATGTLAVAHHLVVSTRAHSLVVSRFVRTLLDGRRALLASEPLFSQTGAPDYEADSFVKVHDAARKIYIGDEPSWTDLALEWIYIVPMVVGALGTLILWLVQRYLHPDLREATELVTELLDIREQAMSAASFETLDGLRHRTDSIARDLTRQGSISFADIEEIGAILSAINLAERQIAERRQALKQTARIV